MMSYGVEVKCGKSAPSVAELKEMGYTHILLATGAWKAGKLDIEGNVQGVIELDEEGKEAGQAQPLRQHRGRRRGQHRHGRRPRRQAHGRARHHSSTAAPRSSCPPTSTSCSSPSTRAWSSSSWPLPSSRPSGMLLCDKMVLGEPDDIRPPQPRRSPASSSPIPCDLVLSAVGEQVDSDAHGRKRHRDGAQGPRL